MRLVCLLSPGRESTWALPIHLWWAVCCGSSSHCHGVGAPIRGIASQPAVSAVGCRQHWLIDQDTRDHVSLEHRGGTDSGLGGAAVAGFGCGRDPAAMTRPGVCSGVEYGGHTSAWNVVRRRSTSRAHTRRGCIRTKGHAIARGGTGSRPDGVA